MDSATSWQPSASLELIKARASLNATIRAFFVGRGVLEVETPILSRAATVDRHIDSFTAVPQGAAGREAGVGGWLQTSPEFAMKRLLAVGSGAIYQIARVFRAEEQGRHHNPEFTLLEWYRPGFDHHALMDEVAALVQACGAPAGIGRLSYREAFQRHAGIDPFTATPEALQTGLRQRGVATPHGLTASEQVDRDFWLDLWMTDVVGPKLGREAPEFLYDFPASQAALSRIRRDDPPVAERFELFWRGVELANGFHELTDAAEQQARFKADQAWRAANERIVPPYDAALIAALQHGLPPCAGVALGLDRLLMMIAGAASIDAVLAFPAARA